MTMLNTSNIPSWFMLPIYIPDKLLQLLTGDELKVLLVVFRHVLGWKDSLQSRCKRISLTMLQQGFSIKLKNPETGEYYLYEIAGTGLSRHTVSKALKILIDIGIICYAECDEQGNPIKNNDGYLYAVPDYPTINLTPLQDRLTQKQTSNRTRNSKMTTSKATALGGSSHEPPHDENGLGGSSHEPLGGSSHEPNIYIRETDNKNISPMVEEANASPVSPDSPSPVNNSPSPKTDLVEQPQINLSVEGDSFLSLTPPSPAPPSPIGGENSKDTAIPDGKPESAKGRENSRRYRLAVAYGMYQLDQHPNAEAIRVYRGPKDKGVVGQLAANFPDLTAETLTAFFEWYKTTYPTYSKLKKLDSISNYLVEYLAKRTVAPQTPTMPRHWAYQAYQDIRGTSEDKMPSFMANNPPETIIRKLQELYTLEARAEQILNRTPEFLALTTEGV